MKQAILFDFWQTLFNDRRERQTLSERQELVRQFLINRGTEPPANLKEAYEAGKAKFFQVYQTEQRTATVIERLTWTFQFCGIQIPNSELKTLAYEFGELGLTYGPEPTPFVKETVEMLSKDYLLGIVSDTGWTPGRVLRRHLAAHGMLGFFQGFSFSNETGCAKPHPRAFTTVLEQMGVAPEDALHCGDLPNHDILGAKNLGLTTVLYTGVNQAELDGIIPDYSISDWRTLPEVVAKVFS